MARRPAAKPFDLNQLALKLTEGLSAQIARPNIYAYKPHKKQMIFHKAEAHTRLYIGGNRSGKTTGGAAEAVYWLMKSHPYRRLPLPEGPVRGRGVAVDFNYGVDILMLPEIKRWLPPSALINGSWEDSYDMSHRMLTLANKSFMEFRSYEQDLEKHAGTSRHFVWFDEEPPKHIYDENMLRLLDTNGFNWLSMTPVEGVTWTYETLYLAGLEGKNKDIAVIEIDTNENPHLSKVAIERVMGALDPEERKARERGEYISVGGKIFKMFHEETHTIDPIIPSKEWEWYASLDHGYNNPTAILFHAVSPDNKIITFGEHYEREMIISDHAAATKKMIESYGKEPDYFVGDPAINQRSGHTGTSVKQEYAESGVYWADANNDVSSGIIRMISYLKNKDAKDEPLWIITKNCTNLISEMKKLRWRTFSSKKANFQNNRQEQIHKKDDHACDSARYFFSFMPDLTPSEPEGNNPREIIKKHSGVISAVIGDSTAGSWDALASQTTRPKVTHWEETYGFDFQ